MKIIAKQIAPEWQESPLFIDGFFPDNIAVYGNRNFNTHFPEVVSRVRECLENGETADAIQDFETEYFNTGTEWIITDEDGEDDFTIYCHAWNTDGIKQEIADASGASPDNITLLAFDGYKHIAQYKEVV